MFGIDDAIIASTISAGASMFASNSAAASQRETNEANVNLNAENRQWQTQMSNTAHQREVADLRAAGLNPILSATGGSGALTPSGNVATIAPEVSSATASLAANSISSGIGALTALANARNANASAALTEAEVKHVDKYGSKLTNDPIKGGITNLAGGIMDFVSKNASSAYKNASSLSDKMTSPMFSGGISSKELRRRAARAGL